MRGGSGPWLAARHPTVKSETGMPELLVPLSRPLGVDSVVLLEPTILVA